MLIRDLIVIRIRRAIVANTVACTLNLAAVDTTCQANHQR
jgi:hypothetical protein